MSQFVMCKSRTNLEEYGGERFSLQKINSDLYRSVLNKYYPNKGYYDIWIIENIHDLCDKALDYDRFIVSELYHVLDKLYELCEWIILWYGDEYEDLKEIHTKKEFINYVRYCVENLVVRYMQKYTGRPLRRRRQLRLQGFKRHLIVTTQTHPFYVEGKGWTEAGELTEEDCVLDSEGRGACGRRHLDRRAQGTSEGAQLRGGRVPYVLCGGC